MCEIDEQPNEIEDQPDPVDGPSAVIDGEEITILDGPTDDEEVQQ